MDRWNGDCDDRAVSVGRCHTCPLRQSPCAGACACTVDGVDIAEHVRQGHCPHPDGSRFGPSKPAAPRERWPFVIRILAARKIDGEKGVGDTAKRLLHKMGADGLAWLYEKATGRPCGCSDRQAKLNQLYPYGTSTTYSNV